MTEAPIGAFAFVLHGSDTLLGIFGGMLPCGP